MAIKECIDCGSSISTEAKRCPKCGARNVDKGSQIRFFILFFLFFIPVSMYISSCMTRPYEQKSKSSSNNKTNSSQSVLRAEVTPEEKSIIELAVRYSDDYEIHGDTLIRASMTLVVNGYCDVLKGSDIKEFGWSRSVEYTDRPMYFTYCNPNKQTPWYKASDKYYVDVSTEELFHGH